MYIKPIETEYKGYRFRSRLEARWAVFFDAIGARWEYEPEGFELRDGTRYLPDFLLHDVRGRGAKDIYVEIKGLLTLDDKHKIEMFHKPIIIFGQIPDAELREGTCNGETYRYWVFHYGKDGDEAFYNLQYSEGYDYWTEPKAGIGGGLVLDYPDDPYAFVDDNLTEAAFRKARQARFEHGEHGAEIQPRFTKEDVMRWAQKEHPSLYVILEKCTISVQPDGKDALFQRIYIITGNQFECLFIEKHKEEIESQFQTKVSVA